MEDHEMIGKFVLQSLAFAKNATSCALAKHVIDSMRWKGK